MISISLYVLAQPSRAAPVHNANPSGRCLWINYRGRKTWDDAGLLNKRERERENYIYCDYIHDVNQLKHTPTSCTSEGTEREKRNGGRDGWMNRFKDGS